jgi:hypothetical protein
MNFTNEMIEALEPLGRRYTRRDSKCLYIEVYAGNYKYWRTRFFCNEKKIAISLGKFPFIQVEQARKFASIARELNQSGVDELSIRKEIKDLVSNELKKIKYRVPSDELKSFLLVYNYSPFCVPKTTKVTSFCVADVVAEELKNEQYAIYKLPIDKYLLTKSNLSKAPLEKLKRTLEEFEGEIIYLQELVFINKTTANNKLKKNNT